MSSIGRICRKISAVHGCGDCALRGRGCGGGESDTVDPGSANPDSALTLEEAQAPVKKALARAHRDPRRGERDPRRGHRGVRRAPRRARGRRHPRRDQQVGFVVRAVPRRVPRLPGAGDRARRRGRLPRPPLERWTRDRRDVPLEPSASLSRATSTPTKSIARRSGSSSELPDHRCSSISTARSRTRSTGPYPARRTTLAADIEEYAQ